MSGFRSGFIFISLLVSLAYSSSDSINTLLFLYSNVLRQSNQIRYNKEDEVITNS